MAVLIPIPDGEAEDKPSRGLALRLDPKRRVPIMLVDAQTGEPIEGICVLEAREGIGDAMTATVTLYVELWPGDEKGEKG